MGVRIARPDVKELVFHLYGRSVHPELLTMSVTEPVSESAYSAAVAICDAGHVVEFRRGNRTVTELATTACAPLPQRKRCVDRRIKGCRDESRSFPWGVDYQTSFQLERLEPEVYANVHEELLVDARKATLAQEFSSGNRMAPGAISLIRIESEPHALLVHAYHTFPENCAVVKTQSLFQVV